MKNVVEPIDWESAPPWAQYRTVDKNGQVTFWQNKPVMSKPDGFWCDSKGGKYREIPFKEWQKSLSSRF